MGIPQIQQQEIARRKSRENSPSQPGKVRCGFFLTAANQQPEKNPEISRNCPWHFRKIGYNRSVPQGNIEDLCNGSTPDSDSVCGGSNPSSSAMKKALASASAFFNEINPLWDLWNACGREWIYFISLSASAENFTSACGAYFTFCKAT